ncbi:D-cysteine desulfhydrase [Candidatus Njordibacter sp. Uisw_039]|jgi:L-cysteate sulfo-lyase|uniref:D-cysteine desulfhydrase n=1 Tax=Candidatus Njordibacter sp. Uisw_039 TaxID=3230972 RepID=UPI003AFC40D4|tara:strand:+ start:2654 stop:3652 length:999 start_codon:yes stop_codon:yes gene_type:complete
MHQLSHPKIQLGHWPTPLEPMLRINEMHKGPELWVKRDDCTGLAFGGNKTRKLEYLLADAQLRGATTLLTAGGVQSNHARQTAAAAARVGLGCELFLEQVEGISEADYSHSGNLLLDQLLGARLHRLPAGQDLDAAMALRAQTLSTSGQVPYVMPVGGSNAIGAMGYVDCGLELAQQLQQYQLSFDAIVLATGSAGTQAGLLAGLALAGIDIPVLGVTVSRSSDEQCQKVLALLHEVQGLLEQSELHEDHVICFDKYYGSAYGDPTPQMVEAVRLAASLEGLLLDPVYSGKAFAGLLDLVRHGYFDTSERVLFLHTGGAPGLFAYSECLSEP